MAERPTSKPAAKQATPKAAAKPKPSSGAKVVDEFIAHQAPDKQVLLKKLAALADKHVPGAEHAIKWGAPFYIKDGKNICALGAFKNHVLINFFGPPAVFVDPEGKLEGSGSNNRSLKVRTAEDIDAAAIARWLKAAIAASK